MPLSLEPMPEGVSIKKMIRIMENFPIISPLRKTDKQFSLFSNQVQCETIIQQFDDICGCIVQEQDLDANIKHYNFTCKQIQQEQLIKFNQLIKNCQIKAEQSQVANKNIIHGDLIVQFGQLLQDMISVTQQSADALTKHFARRKHDILLSFNVDIQRIQWEIDNLQDVLQRLQEKNTKMEVIAEDKQKEVIIAMKRIQNMLPDCRNNINVLDIQQKISMTIICPVCDENLTQNNLLLVMYPCGCAVCQKCFKEYNTKKNNNVCVGCGEIIEDHAVDGVVASRLQELRLDFSQICHSIIRELAKIQQTSVEILQNVQ